MCTGITNDIFCVLQAVHQYYRNAKTKTITRKNDTLTVDKQKFIDASQNEGNPLQFIDVKLGVHNAVYQYINEELRAREKCGRKLSTSNNHNYSFEKIEKQIQFKFGDFDK